MSFPAWLNWTVLAVVCWGLWAVASKLIGDALSAGQSQALSTLGMLPVMLALARHAAAGKRNGVLSAGAAGAVVCLGNVAYYYALKIGGAAAAVVSVTALYPLVTVALALIFLGERLNRVQMGGIVLALASIVIFNIASTSGLLTGWLAYAMLPIALWGVGGFLQKVSTNSISGECSTFWFLAAFVPVGAVLLVLEPLPVAPSARVWMLSGALGLLFSAGNLALLFAFARNGKASIIAPLAGIYPLVSIPVAIVFLGEKVGAREWLGIALALASVVALAWEERRAPSNQEK